MQVHTPSSIAATWFGLFRVRSPLLTESHFVFSSYGYLDVSVPRVSLLYAMYLRIGDRASLSAGFPHSEICVSSVICTYTQLIAACHVLRRLLVPGHSPYALSSLTFRSFTDPPFELLQNVFFFIRQRLRLSIKTIHSFLVMYYPNHHFLMSSHSSQDSLFSFQGTNLSSLLFLPHFYIGSLPRKLHGGLEWNRTIDLTLIRRAL